MKKLVAVLGCVVAGVMTFVPKARATEIELDWTAAEGCPAREAVAAALSARLESAKSAHAVKVTARIERAESGFRLELHARTGDLERKRELQAQSCDELAQATVLIAALIADMAALAERDRPGRPEANHAPTRPTDRQAPPTPEPADLADERAPQTPWSWFARVQWLSDLGSLPAVSFGPGLGVGVLRGRFRAELGGAYLLPRTVSVPARPLAVAELRVVSAAVSSCFALLTARAFALAPCARAEYGRILGRSDNVSQPARGGALWLVGLLGLRADFELTRSLALSAEFMAGFPFDRARFAIAGIGEVHALPAVIGRGHAGVEWRF